MDVSELAARSALFDARVASYGDAPPGYADLWRRWCDVLLARGGMLVVPHLAPDPDLPVLLDSAVGFGPSVRLVPGLRSACHQNAAALWVADRVDSLGSGYALSDDGLWRQHSWGLDGDVVVETTLDRVDYFGLHLTGVDAALFAASNAWDELSAEISSGSERGLELRTLLRSSAWRDAYVVP